MTYSVTPHAPTFAPPQPRIPAPDRTVPELWADPRMAEDPAGLLCELVDTFGEDRALAMWFWAHNRLRVERCRLIGELLFVQRQAEGDAA